VIARLRRWLDRPINDAERGRAFALAATVVLLALGALLMTRPADRQEPAPAPPHGDTARPAPPPADPPPPERSPGVERSVPGERKPARSLARAARRFLPAYLRYLYRGRLRRPLPAASRALERRLAGERLRPSPAARRRDPRVVSLRARGPAGRKAVVTALVDDGGVARYPIQLALERRRGRWVVTRVAGD
jgi:hypothetical protein